MARGHFTVRRLERIYGLAGCMAIDVIDILRKLGKAPGLLGDEDPLVRLFDRLLEYRELATKALEPFRAEGHRSTDAQIVITPTAADRSLLEPRLALLADLFIVSDVALAEETADSGS